MTTARRGVFALAVVVQLAVLYAPTAPGVGGGLRVDLLVHVVVFAAVVWSGRRAGVSRLLLVVLFAVHAGASEIVQGALLSGRSGDPVDVLADLVGVAVGALLPTRRGGPAPADADLGVAMPRRS